MPFESHEHATLEQTALLGGPLVSVRFYLGRLLGKNLFRESDAEVGQRLHEFIATLTSPAGGELMRRPEYGDVAYEVLRY